MPAPLALALALAAPYVRRGPSQDIPLSDPRLLPSAPVEQVHLTGGGPDAVIVTWVTNSTAALPSTVHLAAAGGAWSSVTGPPGQVYSMLMNPRYPATEGGGCQGGANYTNPDCYYTSGEVHSVTLGGLAPGTAYQYRIEGDSRTLRFATPPAVAAAARLRLAVVGDLGQTLNSSHTVANMLKRVEAGGVDLVLHAGDLAYADGDGHRWDSYARLGEALWSRVPTAHTGGNHEVASGNENWINYKVRYPNLHARSGSDSFLWYSFEAGPAHVITLCSYADFAAQLAWLRRDVAGIDRARTPWVIAMWHTPWYTSNHHHPMSEGAKMRQAMEALLLQARVDVVFNGHVHAYERTHPVPTAAGITHITIGDGGNREQFATPWNDPQPAWSALRQDAYGFSLLELDGAAPAQWTWLRNTDAWNPTAGAVGDRATLAHH